MYKYSVKSSFSDAMVSYRSGSRMVRIQLSEATQEQLQLLKEQGHPAVTAKKESPPKEKKSTTEDE